MTASTTSLPSASSRGRDAVQVVVAAVLWATAMVAVAPMVRVPAHVEQLTIVNPHAWRVTVTATATGDEDAWNAIGTVEGDATQSFRDVVDHGDEWTVRFAYLGHDADVQVSRERLERDAWRVTVPDQFASRLDAAGVSETRG